MSDITPEQIATATPIILYALAQIAAIFGKPAFISANPLLSASWDAICANYGKAKNAQDSGA